MPLVEFVCPDCGERQELLVRATADAVARSCPKCDSPMQRQLASFNCSSGAALTGSSCSPGGGFS